MKLGIIFTALAAAAILGFSAPTEAAVRFGKNVRIGGHDVSGQTFDSQRRGLYVIHQGRPSNPGCRWVRHRDGTSTKVCHLQRK